MIQKLINFHVLYDIDFQIFNGINIFFPSISLTTIHTNNLEK